MEQKYEKKRTGKFHKKTVGAESRTYNNNIKVCDSIHN